jgi:hypothetical protein
MMPSIGTFERRSPRTIAGHAKVQVDLTVSGSKPFRTIESVARLRPKFLVAGRQNDLCEPLLLHEVGRTGNSRRVVRAVEVRVVFQLGR